LVVVLERSAVHWLVAQSVILARAQQSADWAERRRAMQSAIMNKMSDTDAEINANLY
jgi:hypothetical protein